MFLFLTFSSATHAAELLSLGPTASLAAKPAMCTCCKTGNVGTSTITRNNHLNVTMEIVETVIYSVLEKTENLR